MGRELSAKTKLIREVLAEHPGWANKEVADWINDSKKLDGEVKPQDIAQAKQALKKAGESRLLRVPDPAKGEADGGEEGQASAAVSTTPPREATEEGRGLTRDDLTQLQQLAAKAGGISELIVWLEMLRRFQP